MEKLKRNTLFLIILSFIVQCGANDRYPPCGAVALFSCLLIIFGLFTYGGGIALLIVYYRTRKELLTLTADMERKVDSSKIEMATIEKNIIEIAF